MNKIPHPINANIPLSLSRNPLICCQLRSPLLQPDNVGRASRLASENEESSMVRGKGRQGREAHTKEKGKVVISLINPSYELRWAGIALLCFVAVFHSSLVVPMQCCTRVAQNKPSEHLLPWWCCPFPSHEDFGPASDMFPYLKTAQSKAWHAPEQSFVARAEAVVKDSDRALQNILRVTAMNCGSGRVHHRGKTAVVSSANVSFRKD